MQIRPKLTAPCSEHTFRIARVSSRLFPSESWNSTSPFGELQTGIASTIISPPSSFCRSESPDISDKNRISRLSHRCKPATYASLSRTAVRKNWRPESSGTFWEAPASASGHLLSLFRRNSSQGSARLQIRASHPCHPRNPLLLPLRLTSRWFSISSVRLASSRCSQLFLFAYIVVHLSRCRLSGFAVSDFEVEQHGCFHQTPRRKHAETPSRILAAKHGIIPISPSCFFIRAYFAFIRG